MTKRSVFELLLGEYYASKEVESDRSQATLKRFHDEYEGWLKKYDEAK